MSKTIKFFAFTVLVLSAAHMWRQGRGGFLMSVSNGSALRDAPGPARLADDDSALGQLKAASPEGAAPIAVPAAPDVQPVSLDNEKTQGEASSSDAVDLSNQFPPNKIPDQGAIGSCHDFAAVGLVEAAYYRHFKIHRALQEKDLFAQTIVCTGEFCKDADVYKARNGSMQCSLAEGGDVSADVQYILGHGILIGDDADTSYAQFKSPYVHQVQEPAEKEILKDKLSSTWWHPDKHPGIPKDVKPEVAELTQNPPNAKADRKAMRQSLEGFVTESKTFSSRINYLKAPPAECLKIGEKRQKLLLAELRAGRPAAIGMDLMGLVSWREVEPDPTDPRGTPSAMHAFLIIGYRYDQAGNLIFQTRNSWVYGAVLGDYPFSPNVTADELCRVNDIVTLRTPEEVQGN